MTDKKYAIDPNRNVQSIRLVRKDKLNLNEFAVIDGHSADIIARADGNVVLALKIESWRSPPSRTPHLSFPGIQITKAEIFNRDVFEEILNETW